MLGFSTLHSAQALTPSLTSLKCSIFAIWPITPSFNEIYKGGILSLSKGCEYYRGIQLDKPTDSGGNSRNPPHAYRFEPTIDFDWGGTGRLARIGSDLFSARWFGLVELPVGRWKFKVTSDDGVRLFLDSRLLIDSWVDQAATLHEAIVDLAAGRRALRLEYYERSESAVCRLELERMFGPGESIPI